MGGNGTYKFVTLLGQVRGELENLPHVVINGGKIIYLFLGFLNWFKHRLKIRLNFSKSTPILLLKLSQEHHGSFRSNWSYGYGFQRISSLILMGLSNNKLWEFFIEVSYHPRANFKGFSNISKHMKKSNFYSNSTFLAWNNFKFLDMLLLMLNWCYKMKISMNPWSSQNS